LGLAGDYIAPLPMTTAPDHERRTVVPKTFNAAGIDSGNIIIRGGNHLEWSWAPIPAGTLRGVDLSAYYTSAWFDRYLKKDRTADRRLLTNRWQRDPKSPDADPNLFSEFYGSRLDIHKRGGKHVVCDDLRTCTRLTSKDCGPKKAYGYLPIALGQIPTIRGCRALRRPAPRAAHRRPSGRTGSRRASGAPRPRARTTSPSGRAGRTSSRAAHRTRG
ncbi:MAG: hypothetical protein QOF76_5121, partial [Solirubrobacteraceae bacterium]|nr:hypothetical protein [Solirubrobacteraceae bacterium]